jgi:hypothetical protein
MTELYKKWSAYVNYNPQLKKLIDNLPDEISDEIFKIIEYLILNRQTINSSQEKITQFFDELPTLLITELYDIEGHEVEPNIFIKQSIYNPLLDEFLYKTADDLYYTKEEMLINIIDAIDYNRVILKIKDKFNIR